MTGPLPKDPSIRARRNKSSTHTILRAVPDAKVPPLPEGVDFHQATKDWWIDTWRSPMAPEYLDTDFHGIVRLAYIVDEYNRAADARDAKAMLSLAGEIRLQSQAFGLTPIDRRRLQWTIEQGEAAEERTQDRRKSKSQQRKVSLQADPRELLA